MARIAATFLTLALSACGPSPTTASDFGLSPVRQTPCGWKAGVAQVKRGEVATVALAPTRSDVAFSVVAATGVEAAIVGDSLEVRAPLDSTLETATVELEVACGGTREPGRVEVTVSPSLAWGQPITWAAGQGPTAREHPSLYIDPSAPDVLWLFGGFTFEPRQFTVVNELWKLDLVTRVWTQVQTVGAPMVAGGRLVGGRRPNEAFLVGGQDPADEYSTDVFRFDLSQTPVRVEPIAQVQGRGPLVGLGGVVMDATRDRLVTFGGYGPGGVNSTVQTLTIGATPTWADAMVTTRPTGRYGFFADRDNDRFIVFSGGQQPTGLSSINPAGDAWALSLSTLSWERLAMTSRAAPGRRNGCGAIDPATRRFFVWSGTADGATPTESLSALELGRSPASWAMVSLPNPPAARGSCAGVFDAARRRVLLGFGNTASARYADLQVLELGPAPTR